MRSRGRACERRQVERSRSVLLVLEHDGPAYRAVVERARKRLAREIALRDANPGKPEFIERAKRATDVLAEQERSASRLFIVDAGLDAAALRARYPDRQRYAIVSGRLRPGWYNPNRKEQRRGYIESIEAGTINVPHARRGDLPDDAGRRRGQFGGSNADDRFTAEIAFGKRFEPWMRTVSRPDNTAR